MELAGVWKPQHPCIWSGDHSNCFYPESDLLFGLVTLLKQTNQAHGAGETA